MREPDSSRDTVCFCPLTGLLDVVAKKWALLIIAILGNEGEKGFNELKSELGCISPKPLSDTLKNLEKAGLVRRDVIGSSPPAVRYSLTPDGWDLRSHLIPLLVWVSGHGGHAVPGCPVHVRNGK